MPVEAKPLFRPDVLRSHVSACPLPTVDRSKVQHWAQEITSGRIDQFRESEILSDLFVDLLGYSGPAGHTRYTVAFERYVEVD